MSEWIPCNEQLPENHTRVLVTINIPFKEPKVRSSYYFDGLFSNDNGDLWKAGDKRVKAWMPTPEPYKEENYDT